MTRRTVAGWLIQSRGACTLPIEDDSTSYDRHAYVRVSSPAADNTSPRQRVRALGGVSSFRARGNGLSAALPRLCAARFARSDPSRAQARRASPQMGGQTRYDA